MALSQLSARKKVIEHPSLGTPARSFVILTLLAFSTSLLITVSVFANCGQVFRTVAPPLVSALFAKDASKIAPIKLKLESQFTKIQQTSDAAVLMGRGRRSYEARLVLTDQSLEYTGKVTSFGASSESSEEAPFRNLKLTIPQDGSKSFEFYIDTHMHNSPTEKWTPQGRVTDGTSPYREALAYDLAATVGVKTPAYRRALIEYHDLGTKEVFEKPALLIENYRDTAEAFGGKIVTENAYFTAQSQVGYGAPLIEPALVARAELFQVLIGNTDFQADAYNNHAQPTLYYTPLRNIALMKIRRVPLLQPVVFDFDIASMVAGYEISPASKPWSVQKSLRSNTMVAVMLKRLLGLRLTAKDSDLRSEVQRFFDKRPDLERVIQTAAVDEVGRAIANQHLVEFYTALGEMWRPDIQFLQSENVRFFETVDRRGNLLKKNKIESRVGTLRKGTPFLILGYESDLLKIELIDIKFDLKDYKRPVGYIKENVKYTTAIPEQSIPYFDTRAMYQ